MAGIRLEGAQRWYAGADRPAVPGIDLEIRDGEFMVLVGPSGCGKSTTLRMLAGLEEVNAGKIYVGDKDVTDTAPKDRDIAMVFQNYALYPHMSVADNMAFALKMSKVPKAEQKQRVDEAARIPGLTDFTFLDRRSRSLHTDWESAADVVVSILRTETGRDPQDDELQSLIGELCTRSDDFRRLWNAHNVRHHGTGYKRFRHPVVGELTIAYEGLEMTSEPGLTLTVYTAEPGSPSEESLRMLGNWAATEYPDPVKSQSRAGA